MNGLRSVAWRKRVSLKRFAAVHPAQHDSLATSLSKP
jgi:hypothetical protein